MIHSVVEHIHPQKTSFFITILQFLAFFLLGQSYLQSNDTLVLLADCLVYIIIVFSSYREDFITYTFLMPLTGLMPSNIFRLYVCVFISLIKLMFIKDKMSLWCFLGLMYLSLNFIIFDLLIGGHTSLLTLLSFMFYIFMIVDKKVVSEIDAKRLAWMTFISCILILLLMLIASPSLDYFIYSDNLYNKFGEQTRDIGGSMRISLYSCIGVSVSSVIICFSKGFQKFLGLGAIVFFLFFSLIALSRTFFLALAIALAAMCLFNLFNINKLRTKASNIVVLGIALVVAVVIINYISSSQAISIMLEKLGVSINNLNQTSSRFLIWKSILLFLPIHPITLLFGGGTNNYMWTNSSIEYKFHGYGAHNLLLETIMSFGVVGLYFLLKMLFSCIKNLKQKSYVDKVIVGNGAFVFPIVLYWSSQMAQGSFRDLETYIFPLMIYIVVYGNFRKQTDG